MGPGEQPSAQRAEVIDVFADAVYDLLAERAKSWGLLDVGVEVEGWFIDGELLFSVGADMGFSLDSRSGVCAYCELVDFEGETGERWLSEHAVAGIDLDAPDVDGQRREQVLRVLEGVLAARRPLLVKVDTPPRPPSASGGGEVESA